MKKVWNWNFDLHSVHVRRSTKQIGKMLKTLKTGYLKIDNRMWILNKPVEYLVFVLCSSGETCCGIKIIEKKDWVNLYVVSCGFYNFYCIIVVIKSMFLWIRHSPVCVSVSIEPPEEREFCEIANSCWFILNDKDKNETRAWKCSVFWTQYVDALTDERRLQLYIFLLRKENS